jgi:hypothetical protein
VLTACALIRAPGFLAHKRLGRTDAFGDVRHVQIMMLDLTMEALPPILPHAEPMRLFGAGNRRMSSLANSEKSRPDFSGPSNPRLAASASFCFEAFTLRRARPAQVPVKFNLTAPVCDA